MARLLSVIGALVALSFMPRGVWASTGTVEGTVYCDDGDGVVSAGDTPLDGITLHVYASGTIAAEVITPDDQATPGHYSANVAFPGATTPVAVEVVNGAPPAFTYLLGGPYQQLSLAAGGSVTAFLLLSCPEAPTTTSTSTSSSTSTTIAWTFGGEDTGFLPPAGTALAKCESAVAKATGKLMFALVKCHVARASGKLTDEAGEDACESVAIEKFATKTKTAGCGGCTNLSTIANAIEGIVDSNNSLAYCSSGN